MLHTVQAKLSDYFRDEHYLIHINETNEKARSSIEVGFLSKEKHTLDVRAEYSFASHGVQIASETGIHFCHAHLPSTCLFGSLHQELSTAISFRAIWR